MENCIKSLLPGGNEVEILIVDDGSTKDNTAEIADRYEKEYPGICKAIHQENGGHGAAVNAGLKAATGIYFKVVDSDDWVNEQAYRQVLDTLRRFVYGKDTLDMLITNFVYEKQGAKHKKVMNYNLALPKNEIFTWSDVKVFVAGQYILMHSVVYRTELLRDCKLELPEHTFYVDNIFVYEPLPHVHTMYYLDVNFYRYFIGRSDQSVNEQVMIGRIDQQIRVTKLMLLRCDKDPEPEAPPLYGPLSGDHDGHLLDPCDQVWQRGEYGKEKSVVGRVKEIQSGALPATPLGLLGTGHEPSGKRRKIPLHRGI